MQTRTQIRENVFPKFLQSTAVSWHYVGLELAWIGLLVALRVYIACSIFAQNAAKRFQMIKATLLSILSYIWMSVYRARAHQT